MIIIPYESIECQKGEDIHTACKRIQGTRQATAQARIVTANMTVGGVTRKLISVYAPVRQKPHDPMSKRSHFFSTALNRFINRKTVMGMDANCVPDTDLDLKRTANSPYDNEGAAELADLVAAHGLADITRENIGATELYTSHHKVAGGECWSRIDQIYAPEDGDTQWTHVACNDFFPPRKEVVELDHQALEVRSKKVKPDRGNDLEYINEKIFDNPGFVSSLAAVVQTAKGKMDESARDGWRNMWEELKRELRKQCVKETAKLRYAESQALRDKKKQLEKLNENKQDGSATADQITRAEELADEIKTQRREEYTLHQTLEKEAYNLGKAHDRCTREFFRPWKDTHAAQHVEKMKEADWSDPSNPSFTGSTVSGSKKVLKELTKYYTALFSKKTIDDQAVKECLETLSDPQSRRVLPPTAEKCGAPIMQKEVDDVLNDLPTGKQPGPDRLPNKLYKVLAVPLSTVLVKVFNESHEKGALPETTIQGLISVLYKKNDRQDPRNYRPITLLNGDYKILTRILTRRMNEAIVQFVSPQQNGFVPGGFLPENIMLLKLIQAYVEDEDSDAYFVFLDMEKAFDRSAWTYLTQALEKIGFNEDFIKYVSLFLSLIHI